MNHHILSTSRRCVPVTVVGLVLVLISLLSGTATSAGATLPDVNSDVGCVNERDGHDCVGEMASESIDQNARTSPPPFYMYVSFAKSGIIENVSFKPADILKYVPGSGWSMIFDASDVGVTTNVTAFEFMDFGSREPANDLTILMAFSGNQNINGVGTFTPQDVARFIPASLGEETAGSFEFSVDGSKYRLKTLAEKIDALGETMYHQLAISTVGTARVLGPSGELLKAQNEDALGFRSNSGEWSLFFDGTPVFGLGVENVNALWVDQITGDLYISINGAFNLSGVRGNGKDIIRLSPDGAGGYTPSLFWDGSANGLTAPIDGLEIVLGVPPELAWPVDCIPGETCVGLNYPDIDGDGKAFNCGQPGYPGHTGTDIGITWENMDQGTAVYAAANGEVLWTHDGEYDRCEPGNTHPDCDTKNHFYCYSGPYYGVGTEDCTWCFTGNLVVLRHAGLANVFATTYGHLRNGSILVSPGQTVTKGQKIAEVGSSGGSTGPHLHFDVWSSGYWEPGDPWAGSCGPNFENSLWQYDPPWGEGSTPFYGADDLVPQMELPVDRAMPYSPGQ